MFTSVFIAVGSRNWPAPIRKHMYSKYLYPWQSPCLARISAAPSPREIAPEPR
jgi:hypothetical protein